MKNRCFAFTLACILSIGSAFMTAAESGFQEIPEEQIIADTVIPDSFFSEEEETFSDETSEELSAADLSIQDEAEGDLFLADEPAGDIFPGDETADGLILQDGTTDELLLQEEFTDDLLFQEETSDEEALLQEEELTDSLSNAPDGSEAAEEDTDSDEDEDSAPDEINEDSSELQSGEPEKAGKGSAASPVAYKLGALQGGEFTAKNQSDYYGFTLKKDTYLKVTGTFYLDSAELEIYEKRGSRLIRVLAEYDTFDSLLYEMYQQIPGVDRSVHLKAGNYVVKVTCYGLMPDGYDMGSSYDFRIKENSGSDPSARSRLNYFTWYSGNVQEKELKNSHITVNVGTNDSYPMQVPYPANFRVGVYCESDYSEGVRVKVLNSDGVTVRLSKTVLPSPFATPIYFSLNLPAGNYKLELSSSGDGLLSGESGDCESAKYHFFTEITYPTPIYKLIDEGSGSFRVYWSTRGVYADGYQIRWSKDKNFKNGVKSASYTGINNTSRLGLDVGSTYYVQVRTWRDRKTHASDTDKKRFYSGWSNAKSIKLTKTLKKASFIRCYNDKGTIRATWKKVAGVEGYQIRYSLNSSLTGAKSASTKGTSYSKGGFSTSKKWYVSIRTYKTGSDGNRYYSQWSTPVKV